MRVSIVIAAYNAEKCLARAIESVLEQTLRDFEIVVVDDGSDDQTPTIAQRFVDSDRRVRLIRNHTNKGVSAARNVGFDAARGDWIAVLDGDDAFAPDRLEQLLLSGEQSGGDMVADDLLFYDWVAATAAGRAIGGESEVRIITISDFFRNCITGKSNFDYGQLKVIFRRDIIAKLSLRYIEDLRHGEDFMIYAHALLGGGRLVFVNRPLYIYTQRVGAISRSASQMSRTIGHLEDMRRHTLALMAHPRVIEDPSLGTLLARRASAIRWFQSWERAYPAVRERSLKRVIFAVFSDWRVGPILMKHVGRHLIRGNWLTD
jgi:succinoglycan biosynthesis protein ExoO